MLSTFKTTTLLMIIVLLNLVHTRFSEAQSPSKPKRPSQSREELKQYLQKVLKHYAMTNGGLRFSRRFNEQPSLHILDDDLFKSFDINRDHVITKSEFDQTLGFKNHDEY